MGLAIAAQYHTPAQDVILMSMYHALCLLFFLTYTRGALDRLGVPEVIGKTVAEGAIVLVVMPVLWKMRWRRPPGGMWVAIFAVTTILSGIVSGDGLYRSFLYFRPLLYAYLVFWAVWNADLKRAEIVRVNRMILLLWIVQVVAACFEVFVLGERVEGHVGTIESHSGVPATAFPMLAMAYLMAFYFYYKKSAWVLALAFCFGIVGYASGKRAIYFLLPLLFFTGIVWYLIRERAVSSLRHIFIAVVILVLATPAVLWGLTQSKRFGHLRGAGYVATLSEALDVALEYDRRVYAGGEETFGRSATSLRVLKDLPSRAFGDYLLGLGPASMTQAAGKWGREAEGIVYGLVNWSKDTLSVGWIAMLSWVAFYGSLWIRLLRRRIAMQSGYIRALQFGCHIGFTAYFLLYFFYGGATYPWFTFVQLYCVALLLSPKHQALRQRDKGHHQYSAQRVCRKGRDGIGMRWFGNHYESPA